VTGTGAPVQLSCGTPGSRRLVEPVEVLGKQGLYCSDSTVTAALLAMRRYMGVAE
jgi:hypothetical protein